MRLSFSLLFFTLYSSSAFSFCGFYVAQAGTKLFNKSSKVVVVRHDSKTVVTMSNDYQGELKDFAMIIPVPEVLKEGQIHVANNKLIDHLDSYTAPRLVEYFDKDPCRPQIMFKSARGAPEMLSASMDSAAKKTAAAFGVKIEANYTVGEYDILILSAKESSGLHTWLTQNKYKLPSGAKKILDSYIKQGLKFFVAKVNLKELAKSGFTHLRPLSMAYESKRFMLPIRLGTLNANGDQELFVFAITKTGRVESTNYRTVKLPSNVSIPPYVKQDFGRFYKDLFKTATKKENGKVLFTEYAWNMSWCDPCAADPLSHKELKELGVFWLNDNTTINSKRIGRPGGFAPRPQSVQAFVTRLHVTYNAKTFPEDLFFQETNDSSNFQGRYILNHPWKGEANACPQAKNYFSNLKERQEKEAQTLASLTNWSINDIRKNMGFKTKAKPHKNKKASWWKSLWD